MPGPPGWPAPRAACSPRTVRGPAASPPPALGNAPGSYRAQPRPWSGQRLSCTTAAACGYATGVGDSATVNTAGGVHGFPAALTSFIGRDGPLREVAGRLAEFRLVTVTGPGGAGKTRLAGQVAQQVAGRFADGAWLAELAPVRDPVLVPAVVAAA